MLENTLKGASRKIGNSEVGGMRQRWCHEIGVALQRRKAAMMRACLPQQSARDAWLLAGELTNASAKEAPGSIHSKQLSLSIEDGEARWEEQD
jgi:hypothetical protein